MEIGVFPAYPRGIAASEIPSTWLKRASLKRVSLKLRVVIEARVSLVVGAAKMLIRIRTLDTVVHQPAMDPQLIMSQLLMA
jgi:hypothetical protein